MTTTRAQLEALAIKLNALTGSPALRFKFADNPADNLKHNIGHYHIDGANGGYALVRIANEAGGEHTIIARTTPAKLADLIRYYIQGINDALPAVSACRRIVAFNMDECVDDNAEHEAIHDIKADAVKALRELAGGAA